MNVLQRVRKTILKEKPKILNPEEQGRMLGVKIGKNCTINPCSFGSEPYLVSIGDHVGIATGVCFITHDGGVWVLRDKHPEIDFVRPIIILDNCMIGMNAILLPGVTIGPNSIVGAGSVVTKDVPPDSIAAGVPAKVIKTLDEFKSNVIDRCVPTKLMSKEEKRSYLLDYFGSTPEEWQKKMHELKNGEL